MTNNTTFFGPERKNPGQNASFFVLALLNFAQFFISL